MNTVILRMSLLLQFIENFDSAKSKPKKDVEEMFFLELGETTPTSQFWHKVYFRIYGRPNLVYLTDIYKADSYSACWKKACNGNSNCAAVFERVLQRCIKSILSAQIILWDQRDVSITKGSGEYRVLEWDQNFNYETLVKHPKVDTPSPPRILWLLDDYYRGENLGQFGNLLNLPTKGLTWKEKGPKKGDQKTYVRITELAQRYRHNVSMLDSRKNLVFDFSLPFTVAMWIRTDYEEKMMIFSGHPAGMPFFGFWETNKLNKLMFWTGVKGTFHTIENNQTVYEWRHIAIVHHFGNDVNFFLNGKVWPLEYMSPFVNKNNLTNFDMWTQPYNVGNNFLGSMACVVMFQTALLQEQIAHLMETCP